MKANIKTVTVTTADRSARWHTDKDTMRLSEVLNEMAARSRLPFEDDLLERQFCCKGCGRRLLRETEQVQPIPVACCALQSLWLTELLPPPTKGKQRWAEVS